MIDHFNIPVRDLDRSLAFYTEVLGVLGRRPFMRDGDAIGFGSETWEFGIVKAHSDVPRLHFCFRASTHAVVDEFFYTAVRTGGTPNGEPGIRPGYDAKYYAAYVLDPDGHNVEAVCRG